MKGMRRYKSHFQNSRITKNNKSRDTKYYVSRPRNYQASTWTGKQIMSPMVVLMFSIWNRCQINLKHFFSQLLLMLTRRSTCFHSAANKMVKIEFQRRLLLSSNHILLLVYLFLFIQHENENADLWHGEHIKDGLSWHKPRYGGMSHTRHMVFSRRKLMEIMGNWK